MHDLNVISIVVGVLGALVGVYFRESFRKATRQKVLASKLEAQVFELLSGFRSSDLSIFLSLGWAWDEEKGTAFREKGPKGFQEAEQKWENMLKRIRAEIEKGSQQIDEWLAKRQAEFHRMPESLFSYHRQSLDSAQRSLVSNQGLISEDEAAEISWDSVARVVQIKQAASRALDQCTLLLLTMREADGPNPFELRSMLSQIVDQLTRLTVDLKPLAFKSLSIRSKSLTRLTIENMLGKP